MIICANPLAQFQSREEEILNKIRQVLAHGHYVLGPEVETLEKSFAHYTETQFAVGLNSGTDALILALRALGIKAGDEVITVSMTALATVSAVLATGATPVLVDIDPEYYTIDPISVKKAITNKTKAIIAVHLYGQAADLDSLLAISKEHGIPLIEDCAQATGGRYKNKSLGSIGDISCFSFYPTKNLGAIGDGGMLVTNNSYLHERVRRLRQYGWDQHRNTTEPGLNSRLDELQAGILNVKFKYLNSDNSRRREIAQIYNSELSQLPFALPQARHDTEHVYHLYALKYDNRDELKTYLAGHQIAAGIHYVVPAHKHGGYDSCCRIIDNMKNTDHLCARTLSLPMYPELTHGEAYKVTESIKSFFRK